MIEHNHHQDVLSDLNPQHRALHKMIPDVYRGFGETAASPPMRKALSVPERPRKRRPKQLG